MTPGAFAFNGGAPGFTATKFKDEMKPKDCATVQPVPKGKLNDAKANARQRLQRRLATIAAIAADGADDCETAGKCAEQTAFNAVSKSVLEGESGI